MRLKTFKHLEPKSLSEACAMLAEYGEKIKMTAGGTDILVRMKQRLVTPEYLMDLKQIAGLNQISHEGGEIRIGALTTLTDIQKSETISKHVPILGQAAQAVGATQLQNMGSIGGNLCLETRCWYYNQSVSWRQSREVCLKLGGEVCHMAKGSRRCYALYSGDLAPALLALDARLHLASSQENRILSLDNFFVNDGKKPNILHSDEIIIQIRIPVQTSGRKGIYLKFRKREAIDFPIVGVGVTITLQEGICRQLSVIVTGVSSSPVSIKEDCDLLRGQRVTKELIETVAESAYKQVKPVSHMEVSPAYRKQLVRVLVKDALSQLTNPSGWTTSL